MIKRTTIEGKNLSPYCLIVETLLAHKDYYLSKEEIYAHAPRDEETDIPLVTISGFETALRTLCHTREITYEYLNGKRYFAINNKKDRQY